MTKLEALLPSASVRGILLDASVTVVNVQGAEHREPRSRQESSFACFTLDAMTGSSTSSGKAHTSAGAPDWP
ncbi:MAG TPA: hypothetical protein VEK15_18700 [Vicinamibacteria bacterium]|nr:hypothetical protein [Vicinamibacteria bacterium]